MSDRLQKRTEEVDALSVANDPGVALITLLPHMVEQAASKRIIVDALAAAGRDVERFTSSAGHDLIGSVAGLLARAQHAGAVRGDIDVNDLLALVVGASRAAEDVGWNRALQHRILGVIFDGLRHRV